MERHSPLGRIDAFLARLSGKTVRQGASALADAFSEKFPPPGARRKAQSRLKIDSALDSLYRDAAAFRREHRLGVLGRARFAKAFQDELLARGYPAELVMKITSAITATALVSDKGHSLGKVNPRS
ncbi:MAG: hypothetical protein A3G25_14145 [Betaproteobacteria bacterium RIFCSPLOWO2_12_FULL_63_13]|nr:MAG: hypothetical protein A3H32_02190 [Betaproteobacteria bacterium RIFCSPLOWO2_02_FULL_63_19]OGA50760.1 MAG: hypothetical protein A3G25_14145 [Betaproteobacteria bacterium RIFCSPLOWO2_12_FULL_63_13]